MNFTIDQLVIFAARAGNLQLLKARVEAGGDVNYIDPKHGSALAESIRGNHIDVVEWLVSNSSDVNVQYRDALGPLEMALHSPNPEIVYCLVCAGAKLTRTSRPHYRNRLDDCLKTMSIKIMEKNNDTPCFDAIIDKELTYFTSDQMRTALLAARCSPRMKTQEWGYGKEKHSCWIIASDSAQQIVYCETGFGPSFPWSCQLLGEQEMGRDDAWHAYLFEAFVTSTMWKDKVPEDFVLMGPGERSNTTKPRILRRVPRRK